MTAIINTANEKFNGLINYVKTNVKFVNFILFTVTFGARLIYIDLQDFENIELLNLYQAKLNPFSFYTNTLGYEVFEPVYLCLTKLLYSLFGLNAYLLRLPSALFSAIASVLVFNFIRTHLNYLAAVWTFLFFLCNYYLNVESQLLHQSTIVLLGITLLINEITKLITNQKNTVFSVILLNTFLFYTSNQMAVVLIFELILILIFNKKLIIKYLLILGATLLSTNYFFYNYINSNKALEKLLNAGFNLDVFLLSFQKLFESEFYFNLFFLIFAIIALNIYFKRMEINLNRSQAQSYSVTTVLTLILFYFIYKTRYLTPNIQHYLFFMVITLLFSIVILKFFAFNSYSRPINFLFLILFVIFILPSISLGNRHENRNKAVHKLVREKLDSELIIIKDCYNFLIYQQPQYFFNKNYQNNLYLDNIVGYDFINKNSGILLNPRYTKFTFISKGRIKADSIPNFPYNFIKEELELGIYHVTSFIRK